MTRRKIMYLAQITKLKKFQTKDQEAENCGKKLNYKIENKNPEAGKIQNKKNFKAKKWQKNHKITK